MVNVSYLVRIFRLLYISERVTKENITLNKEREFVKVKLNEQHEEIDLLKVNMKEQQKDILEMKNNLSNINDKRKNCSMK